MLLFKELKVLAFNNTNNDPEKVERNSYRKNFLPRVNTTNYNVLIDVRSFYCLGCKKQTDSIGSKK